MSVCAAHAARGQRGYMVMVVLVALVAMMVSGVALVRSMDTNQLVAGNLAFRSATVHSADIGVQSAVTWLAARAASAALNKTAEGIGYYAIAGEPNWDDESFWSKCAACVATPAEGDAAGNRISWVIHRMCSSEGNPNDAGNLCSRSAPGGAGATGGSMASDATVFEGSARNYYRVTVRVLGPRNTGTLVQTFLLL